MKRSLLADAFAHHVWATVRLIDTCLELSAEQLDATSTGTYGSILLTMQHLVGADRSYLYATSGGRAPLIDRDRMDLRELRATMETNGAVWSELLAEDPDPDLVIRHGRDESETHAPMGIRLAQALHHGTDHRSQICTILTTLGVEPPFLDVWDYGDQAGQVVEVPLTT